MPLLDKLEIVIILFFVLVSSASCVEFGAYPSEIKVNVGIREKYCSNITLFSSQTINEVKIMDKWADKRSKDINDYIFDSKENEIEMSYSENIDIKNEQKFNFCMTLNQEGNYYGVFLFEVPNSNIVLGVWMNINCYDNNNSESKIVGLSIYEGEAYNSLFLQIVFCIILSVLFIYMMIKIKRKTIYLVS